MFSYLFKTGTYYILWQKFRSQIVTLGVSVAIIMLTFSVYDDVHDLLKIIDKNSLWVLVLVKYSILVLIILWNINSFKTVKIKKSLKKENKVELEPIEEEIKNKKTLLSKTDLILNKYRDNSDD
jgi:hypothetical protein